MIGRYIWLAIVFCAFLAVAYGFGRYLFAALLPSMRQEIGFSYATAGMLASLSQVGGVFAGFTAGRLANAWGAGRVILVSLGLISMGLFGLSTSTAVWQMGFVLAMLGALSGWVWVPMLRIIGSVVPTSDRALIFGVLNASGGRGNVINGTLIAFVLANSGWRETWVAAGLICVVFAILGGTYLVRQGLAGSGDGHSRAPVSEKNELRPPWRTVPTLWLAMFVAGFACLPFQTYLSVAMEDDFGRAAREVGTAWVVLGIVGAMGGIALGSMADRTSVRNTAIAAAFALIAACLSIFYVGDISCLARWRCIQSPFTACSACFPRMLAR